MIEYKDLNPNQRSAADWNDGPLLVLAGPGSGKTEILTLRITRLLQENKLAAVLGLTFTNKAASEMRERIDQRLGKYTDRIRLQTFHKFAAETLSQHGSHIGLRPDFNILNGREDRIAFLEDAIQDFPVNKYPDFPEDPSNLLGLIDRLFSESYNGNGTFSSLESTPVWVQPLFEEYYQLLIGSRHLDFGSLIFLTKQLLIKKPEIVRLIRRGWSHICVDEFQDTNQAQYDLLRLITPERGDNLFVVADDDQLIYQWNGASIQRLQNLKRDYELHTLQFPESYRCPSKIIDLANRLIEKNRTRLTNKRELISLRKSCDSIPVVRYRHFTSLKEEAVFVGEDIEEHGLLNRDCVVLGRTNKLLHSAVRELSNARYDAFLFQKKREFDSPLINILVEALRLTHLRHDRVVLGRLCRAWHMLTGEIIEMNAVDAQAALAGGDFLRAWLNITNHVTTQKDNCLLQIIQNHLLDRMDFRQIINWLNEDECQSFKNQYMLESTEEEINTWLTLDQEIIAEHGTNVPLNTYLHELDISPKSPSPGQDALQCMTIHQAKGLQFKHVYLIGMAQNLFPSFRALQAGANGQQVEEERRSCFVAITRAQNTLTLTRSEEYFGFSRQPSQFLKEMQLL